MVSIQLIAPRRVGSSEKTLFNGANVDVCSGECMVRLGYYDVVVVFKLSTALSLSI